MKMKTRAVLFLSILIFPAFGAAVPGSAAGPENNQGIKSEYDLSLRDSPGDVRFFELKTVYFHGNSLGITQSREELTASFKREVMSVDEDAHLVKFTWNRARLGSAPDAESEITNWKTLPYAEDFSYTIDFRAPNFPGGVDFSPIPENLQGFKFMVNILDAHAQFELLRTEAAGGISRIKKTGDRILNPGAGQSGPWDFNEFITDSDFANGPYETLFAGICLENGRECALLEYINTESRIKNKTRMTPELMIEQEGTSNFWGHIYIDIATGDLIKGDLYEYVIVEVKLPGQNQAMRLFERRLIEIRVLTPKEFDNEI